jgi:N-acetylneuraminate synthase
MDIARKLIDVSYSAGCHYVKFQKRDINIVYTQEELDKERESPWGHTTRQQKEGLEFDWHEYKEIEKYCMGKGIGWFASAWDLNSLAFLEEFNCPFIKIPSALITNDALLEEAAKSMKRIIISTGMSTIEMVDHAVHKIGKDKIYCIMACTSTYPTKAEELNLNQIITLKERYPWAKTGFSNHSPGLIYMPVAIALGASMIEFHVTLDRASPGSDQAASIEPEGVFKLVKYTRKLELAMGDGVKKIYDNEKPIISKLRR